MIFSYPLNDPAETVNEIGSSIRRVMGGTSGIMYMPRYVLYIIGSFCIHISLYLCLIIFETDMIYSARLHILI